MGTGGICTKQTAWQPWRHTEMAPSRGRTSMASDVGRARQRASTADARGRGRECVYSSLLAGTVGLPGVAFTSHAQLLQYVKRKVNLPLLLRSQIRWQGEELRLRELNEACLAIACIQ